MSGRRLLPALALAAAAAGCPGKKGAIVTYTHPKGGFSVDVPSDWTAIEDPDEAVRGVQFLAPVPKGKRAVRHYVAVDFYPAGNPRYAAIRDYAESHSRPMPGYDIRPPAEVEVAGRKARELRWTKPLPASPEFAPKGRQAVRVVLLEAKGGFYAFTAAGPEADGDPHAAVFERLINSLK